MTEERIYHTWDKWECYPAGFYNKKPKYKSMTDEDCKNAYRDFLADLDKFETGLKRVISEWKNSCEHYLTNQSMNRIAWLGQAAMCIETGIPSMYRGGFNRLTEQQQLDANLLALKYLNLWLKRNNRKELSWEEAQSKTEANLY